MKQYSIILQNKQCRQTCLLLSSQFGKISAYIGDKKLATQLHTGMLVVGQLRPNGSRYIFDQIDIVAAPIYKDVSSLELFHDLIRLISHAVEYGVLVSEVYQLLHDAVLYWDCMSEIDQHIILARLFFYVDIFPENIVSYQLIFSTQEKAELSVYSLLRTCWDLYEEQRQNLLAAPY